MTKVTYDKQLTALLVIDPCNDFISEGGKVWDRLKTVAEANDCIPHMLQVLNAAMKSSSRSLLSNRCTQWKRKRQVLFNDHQIQRRIYGHYESRNSTNEGGADS